MKTTMLTLRKVIFCCNAQSITNLAMNNVTRTHSNLQCNAGFVMKTLCCVQGLNYMHHPAHLFHCTHGKRLKTLYSEDEQKKITGFINELDPNEQSWKGRLRILNNIAKTIPRKGPLNTVDDLLEKFTLSTSTAVSLCNAILKSSGKPETLLVKKPQRKAPVPRKIHYLMRGVKPIVQDPKVIHKFTAAAVSENLVSYVEIESQTPNWDSQLLKDWNVIEVYDASTVESVLQLWRELPQNEHYIIHLMPSRGAGFIKQGRLCGAAMALMCAKNNFKTDFSQNIFQVASTTPARFFNLLIGNESVSPVTMVSNILDSTEVSVPDEHVLSRSLAEVTFEDNAVVKYNTFNDNFKESACQGLLAAKVFIELLKEEKVLS